MNVVLDGFVEKEGAVAPNGFGDGVESLDFARVQTEADGLLAHKTR